MQILKIRQEGKGSQDEMKTEINLTVLRKQDTISLKELGGISDLRNFGNGMLTGNCGF